MLDSLRTLGVSTDSDRTILVALSGGLDSCVLLHVLRFGIEHGAPVVAAHYDHAMRPGSVGDAAWVRGLCRAWSVPLREERASEPPSSEDAARRLRYDFLDRMRSATGAAWLVTAHHADDQAETVLFRVLRGTGVRGLAGIPERREPGVVRPLLDVWREELEAYATRHGIRWREDPTNDQLGYARNLIRHELLPLAERVAPGARAALVRLSEVAAREVEAWEEITPGLLDALGLERNDVACSVDRKDLADLGPALRARVVRTLVASLGSSLDRATTRRAVEFVIGVESGKRLELGGAIELLRDRDRIVVRRAPGAGA